MTPALVFVESNTTGTGRDFCRRARARGLRPVVLARDPARYPYVAQDEIDCAVGETGTPEQVLESCGQLRERFSIAGVTSSSELFIAVAAAVAAKLGLPAPDPVAIWSCRNKAHQRQVLGDAGLPVPPWYGVTDVPAALRAADRVGLPCVVKPVDGTGSTGVRLCRTRDEVAAHVEHLSDAAGTTCLVEGLVEGPEFSVEVFDGVAVAVVGKHLTAPPFFVETGHDLPAPIQHEVRQTLVSTAERAVRALRLNWGPVHVELRLPVRGSAVVIEANPRLAGGLIPLLVRLGHGADMVDAAVARAAGQPFSLRAEHEGAASIRFVIAPDRGRLTTHPDLTGVARLPGVHGVLITDAAHVSSPATGSFQDRVGHVICAGSDGGLVREQVGVAHRALLADLEWQSSVEAR